MKRKTPKFNRKAIMGKLEVHSQECSDVNNLGHSPDTYSPLKSTSQQRGEDTMCSLNHLFFSLPGDYTHPQIQKFEQKYVKVNWRKRLYEN